MPTMSTFTLSAPVRLAAARRKAAELREASTLLSILSPAEDTPLDAVVAALPDGAMGRLSVAHGRLSMRGIRHVKSAPPLSAFATLDALAASSGLELVYESCTPYDFELEEGDWELSFDGAVLVVGPGGAVRVSARGTVVVGVSSYNEVWNVERDGVALCVNGDVLAEDFDDYGPWGHWADAFDKQKITTISQRLSAVAGRHVPGDVTRALLDGLARFFVPHATLPEGWNM